jgi:hypothetical protein
VSLRSAYNLVLALIIVFAAACKKPDNSKPTQWGSNNASFVINGTRHYFKGEKSWGSLNGLYFALIGHPDSSIAFQVMIEDQNEFLLMIVDANIPVPVIGKPYVISERYPYVYSFFYTMPEVNHRYYVDTATSRLTFTRYDDEVVAGTFQFNGKNDSGATISITDGWFDAPVK